MFNQDEKATDTKTPVISRRQVLKAMGAGSALVACSALIPTYETYAASDKKQQQDQQDQQGEDNKKPIASHNDLANRDEVASHPASAILDSSNITQQQVNDGLESIADLLAITNPQNGSRVYVKGYHAPNLLNELNPYKGGGDFIWDATSTATANNGTVFQVTGIATGRWIRVDCSIITPEMFGSKGDGDYDDRPAFQAAVDYLWNNRGGELFIPKPVIEYRWKSYDATDLACLVIPQPQRSIYLDPITIRGEGNLVLIKVDLSANPANLRAAILFKGQGLYKKVENISVWGGVERTTPYVDYVLYGADNYHPNLTIRDCQFYVAKVDCVRLATFVTVLDKLQTAYSPRGIVIAKPEGSGSAPCTSITLNSCYALDHTHNGYWFGETTYCTFNSCASDHIINDTGDGYEAYPYYIDIARGVTFNGCGAEGSTRIMRVRAAQGLVVNGIMTLSIGNATTPPNNLIRIDGGASATFAGIWNHNSLGFQYILSVGQAFGTESITVLDESIKSSQATYVSNYGHERPIRFVCEDFTVKTHDLPLTNTGNAATNTTNMNTWMALNYGREYLHDLIIRLPSGDFPISGKVYLFNKFNHGYGRVRFIGHADGTSRIVVSGDGGLNIGLPGKLAPSYATLENAAIHITTMNGTTKGFDMFNGVLTLVNGKITSDNGYRQYAMDSSSKIVLDAISSIATNYFGAGTVEYSYKGTSAPTTSTKLPAGTIFKASDPNATRIGWINTADNGATWLPMVVA